MKEQDRWEAFAKSDAEYFVYTPGVGSRTTDDDYFEHGSALARDILDTVSADVRQYGRAIEIGCGTGRIAIPMAERFEQVVAVDIAPSMLRSLDKNLESRGLTNILTKLADDSWETDHADFIYSVQVFQHVESESLIVNYLPRIAAAMNESAVAYLHFDTRPLTLAYRLRRILPDFILPRPWRRGIRRTRRSTQWLRRVLDCAGLVTQAEFNVGTRNHVVVVRKAETS